MRRPLHLLALLLLVASCSVITACGDDEESGTTGTSATSTAESTPAAKKLKVGLVTDIGGLNDRSFNQLANEGLERAKSELGVETRVLVSKTDSDYIPNLSTLAQQKYDLVVGVGFLMAEAMDTVASKFPDTTFSIIDVDATGLKSKPANVEGLLFKEQEAGYLAGDEAGYPAAQFAEAYAIAADSGLGCTVHAGEHDGAESVRQALTLPISRISHGVRAIEDPALVEEIAERGLVLEVCPTSNIATKVFASYEEHPLRTLHEAGVKLTLGSDDPPYFGATIGGEYAVARERFGFEEGELESITRTAVQGSFAEDAVKRSLLNRITASSDRRN